MSDSKNPTSIVVLISVKSEHREEWLKLFHSMAENVKKHESGAVQYRLLEDEKTPNHFILTERYKTHDDYQKHMTTEYFKEYYANVLTNQKYYNSPITPYFLKEIDAGFYNYSV